MTEPKFKLTLARAKELCDDFHLVTRKDLDNAKACIHVLRDREMCALGSHFVCELVLYKMRSADKAERESEQALSASRITLLDTCSRKYHLQREKYLPSPAGEPSYFKTGRAFSTARARLDMGLPFHLEDIDHTISPVDLAKLRAAVRFYMNHPPYEVGSVTCEAKCHFQFEGTWFLGYADALSTEGSTIIEWKYAAKAYDHLSLARQAAVYFYGFPETSAFVRYRMRKSSHRPGKKGETMAAFEQRILDAYEKDGPTKVMSRLRIERHELDVEGVLREMKHSFERVLPAMRAAGYPPAYGSCEMCDYQTVCGDMIGVPTEQIVRHLELKKDAQRG